jgi:hypothetical protein
MCELLQESLSFWRGDAVCLPPFDRTFTTGEQAAREVHLDQFLQTVERELRGLPRTRSERRSARIRIDSAFTDFAKDCLDLDDSHLELLLNDGFSAVVTQLARQARQFDPAVSAAAIFQGLEGPASRGRHIRRAWSGRAIAERRIAPSPPMPCQRCSNSLYAASDGYVVQAVYSNPPSLPLADYERLLTKVQ